MHYVPLVPMPRLIFTQKRAQVSLSMFVKASCHNHSNKSALPCRIGAKLLSGKLPNRCGDFAAEFFQSLTLCGNLCLKTVSLHLLFGTEFTDL